MRNSHPHCSVVRPYLLVFLMFLPRTGLANPNIYKVDSMNWIDALDTWHPIGRTDLKLYWSGWYQPLGNSPCLNATITVSKAGQMVHGIERRDLNLPLPQAVRFKVWAGGSHLWVVLGDKAGRQISSLLPLPGVVPLNWSQIEIPLSQTVPFGMGAEAITDLDSIAILTQESSEFPFPGPYPFYFANLEAVYPEGVGPQNKIFTRSDLDALLAPLPENIKKIDELLEAAKTKGVDVRYPLVSRTVLQRYHTEVFDMFRDDHPEHTRRMGEFLLECAGRTQQELENLLENPDFLPRVPDISLENLTCRDGSYFSGDRPVFFAGVCGWFNRGQFPQLSAMGYTCLSIELGPTATLPSENEINPHGADGILDVMNAARENHMVCDLLVSPHYFPDWARQKWPTTDATGWRTKTNNFMPWTITDPHFRAVIAKHLSVLIPLVREHPALISYDLINEAWYRLIPDFPVEMWQKYQREHPDLERWQALGKMGTDSVTEFLQWFVAELHKYDTAHPVQIKAISTQEVLNVDREAIGDILTANGMDAMPSWPDWTGRLAADFTWPFLRHDYYRTLQPDHPILDGEYHISDGLFPTPASYFTAALWGLVLHGRDMTSCWVFDRVDDVSLYWHANGVEALGRCALDFLRLGPEIQAFQRQHGPIALFFGGVHIEDAYQACLFQDLDIAVVTEKRILGGDLADYQLLVISEGTQLSPEMEQRLSAFEKTGGTIFYCPPDKTAPELWRMVHDTKTALKLTPAVSVEQWGIEVRSVTAGERKLFYVLNHLRKPAQIRCRSAWNLTNAVNLITGKSLAAETMELQPLEIRLIEAR